jgi:hypothetical protein
MKMYVGIEIQIHAFLTSATDADERSVSRPGRFTTGERAHGIHWTGGWVGFKAALDNGEERKSLILPEIEPKFFGYTNRAISARHMLSKNVTIKIYKTRFFPIALYAYETLSLILRGKTRGFL